MTITMSKQSRWQGILNDLEAAKQDLQVTCYTDLLSACIHLLHIGTDSDSETKAELCSSTLDDSMLDLEILEETNTDLLSLLASSGSPPPLLMFSPTVQQYEYQIIALKDEVWQAQYLATHKRTAWAPQLQLLEQWALDGDVDKFHRKLRVDPEVFKHIVDCIHHHPGFSSQSNNPQFPVPVQLMIFLNGAGHYGNTATTEDLVEWAGVSVGTIYNCIQQVMTAILPLHDKYIHFNPLEEEE